MIREYDERDADVVVDVWYRASRVGHPFLSDDFLEIERADVTDRWLPMAETSVYEIDGRVVGFVSLIGNEVGALFVDPDLHGQGIGRALMDDARARRPYLELGVFEANDVGRRFYEAYGFELVGRHIEEQTGLPELRLRLG